MEIVFLGTGGGRWMTITQKRYTGGFRLHGKINVHVDPGAGAVLRANHMRINPLKTHAIAVSHCHPDHYTDSEVLIEAMTKGMTRKAGTVAASRSVLKGHEHLGPAISKYHRNMVAYENMVSPGDSIKIGDMDVKALKTVHSDPSGIGFNFLTSEGIISYTGDTEYFDGISDLYMGSRVLILNVIRPRKDRLKWHLCSHDVIKILNEVSPETAILTHFGMKMLPVSGKEAKNIQEKSGVKTIAAKDGMKFNVE
jgi:phosphoribosyl 1,2-cyclic phosphodiesterase